MSKIVQAVNAMISNKDKISQVMKGIGTPDEYFFLYKDKHKWSIYYTKNNEEYVLCYYPGKQSLEQLAFMEDGEWHSFFELIAYGSRDLGTVEAHKSMQELYSIVKGKIFGIDEVLDDIIGDDVPF